MSRGMAGQADDLQATGDIQRVATLKPMVDGRWEIVQKAGADLFGKTADLVESFVVMNSGDVILVFTWCIDLATREFLESRNVESVIKMTVRDHDAFNVREVETAVLKKSFNSSYSTKKSSVQKMHLITLDEGVMVNETSSELDDLVHVVKNGKIFPK